MNKDFRILIHNGIQKFIWTFSNKILELKINVLRWNSRYVRVNQLLELTLEPLAAGRCTRRQQFSMSSWILWLQCLVSSVQHVPWLKIKQGLRSGVCRTIRPISPSQTQAQTPATMRLLITFLVAAVLNDQVSLSCRVKRLHHTCPGISKGFKYEHSTG